MQIGQGRFDDHFIVVHGMDSISGHQLHWYLWRCPNHTTGHHLGIVVCQGQRCLQSNCLRNQVNHWIPDWPLAIWHNLINQYIKCLTYTLLSLSSFSLLFQTAIHATERLSSRNFHRWRAAAVKQPPAIMCPQYLAPPLCQKRKLYQRKLGWIELNGHHR